MGEPYAYGYKVIVSNFLFPWLREFHVADAASASTGDIRFHGLARDFLAMAANYFGPSCRIKARPMPVPTWPLNLVLALLVAGTGLAGMLRRVRPRVASRPVFFAADYLGDDRDLPLLREMEAGGRVMIVLRNEECAALLARSPAAGRYEVCRQDDGRLTPRESLPAMGMMVIDIFRLFLAFGSLPSQMFWRIVTMPVKRANLRALLRRFPPRYFWGRDDYNVEHVLRRSELKRVGGVSLGVAHAVPTNFCSLIAQWRYISFDIYYTPGIPLCQPYFPTWAGDMVLRSAGNLGCLPELVREAWPQGEAILVAARVAWTEPELGRIIRAVSAAFPGRRVLVQIKPGYIDPGSDGRVAEWTAGLANVERSNDDIYTLLRRCRYLVSDVSTLIAEAIQLGIPTFFADILEMEYSIFRLFPGLSRRTAAEVVAALRDLDECRMVYPWKEYMALMDLKLGLSIVDAVRQDVGLAGIPPNPRSETNDDQG